MTLKNRNWISFFRLKVSDVETEWVILGILRFLSSTLREHQPLTVILNLFSGLCLQELYILEIKWIKMVIQHLFLLCVSFLKKVGLCSKREDDTLLGNIHSSFADNSCGWTISELRLQDPLGAQGNTESKLRLKSLLPFYIVVST